MRLRSRKRSALKRKPMRTQPPARASKIASTSSALPQTYPSSRMACSCKPRRTIDRQGNTGRACTLRTPGAETSPHARTPITSAEATKACVSHDSGSWLVSCPLVLGLLENVLEAFPAKARDPTASVDLIDELGTGAAPLAFACLVGMNPRHACFVLQRSSHFRSAFRSATAISHLSTVRGMFIGLSGVHCPRNCLAAVSQIIT